MSGQVGLCKRAYAMWRRCELAGRCQKATQLRWGGRANVDRRKFDPKWQKDELPISLSFNLLLQSEGINPGEVRLLRHAKRQGAPGISPYQAWREDLEVFERYQSTQLTRDRRYFEAPYWASFVTLPDRSTLFVGLYGIELAERGVPDFDCPLTARVVPEAPSIDTLQRRLRHLCRTPVNCWSIGVLERAAGVSMQTAGTSRLLSCGETWRSHLIRATPLSFVSSHKSRRCRPVGGPC